MSIQLALAGFSIFQGIVAQREARLQAKYMSAVSNANIALSRANMEFEQSRLQTLKNKVMASNRATFARSGVRFEGTVIAKEQSILREFALDKIAMELNFANSAYSQGARTSAAVTQRKSEGDTALLAGAMQGLSVADRAGMFDRVTLGTEV